MKYDLEKLSIHPAADLFPMMSDEEIAGLRRDIFDRGCEKPIAIYQGQLLDGRNRRLVCLELGTKPSYEVLPDSINPWEYVISHNLHRRHLTTGQRATVAAKLAQRKLGDNQHRQEGGSTELPSIGQAAASMKVSRESVKRAKTVQSRGSEDLQKAVEAGEVTVARAAEVAGSALPKSKHLEVAKAPRKTTMTKTSHKPDDQTQKTSQKISGGTSFNVDELESETDTVRDNSDVNPSDAALSRAKAAKKEFASIRSMISQLKKEGEQLIGSESGVYLADRHQEFLNLLQNIKSYFSVAAPHCVCFKCDGKGCKNCRESGWMSSITAQKFSAPKDIQKV